MTFSEITLESILAAAQAEAGEVVDSNLHILECPAACEKPYSAMAQTPVAA
jgi:hypothetical protein